ncbi:MAG: molybdopterin molybdotransferase MoeA [Gemmatimonadales bacterium]|nr:molybdopterin molybdotransferase MoeA [Gemmatimonadales bacterium]
MPSEPLGVDQAIAAILAELTPRPAAAVPLAECLGLVLAEDVVAPFNLPRWTNAAMDGYAVRADDVRGASVSQPVTLPVVAQLAAGGTAPRALRAGEAMRIFTGAPVPAGADSVIRQEDSDRGALVVSLTSDRDAGRNVRREGSDLAAGSVAFARGTAVGPGEIALLASLAVTEPVVHPRPRVAIISTGDEIAPLDDVARIRSGERIADSNTPALTALTLLAGGVPSALGPVRDDADALADTIRHAPPTDLVVTVGGVSVGDHDHVPAVIAMLGGRLLFRRVRLRPGGPTTAARLPDGRLWIALPGNPVSAMVTFTLFVRPAIRRLSGMAQPVPPPPLVRLAEPVERHPTLDLFLRAVRSGGATDGVVTVRATGPVGSALMTSMRDAEVLVWVAAGPGGLPAGTILPAVTFP